MAGQEDPVQREIHQDWANREYIEVITSSIKKIADFLNSFGELLTINFTANVDMARSASCLAIASVDVDVFCGHSQLAISFVVSYELVFS